MWLYSTDILRISETHLKDLVLWLIRVDFRWQSCLHQQLAEFSRTSTLVGTVSMSPMHLQYRPDPTRAPEQTLTKPPVCSRGVLGFWSGSSFWKFASAWGLLWVYLASVLGLLRICFCGSLYALKYEEDQPIILPPESPATCIFQIFMYRYFNHFSLAIVQ